MIPHCEKANTRSYYIQIAISIIVTGGLTVPIKDVTAFSGGSFLQTLSRGLRVLEVIGELDRAPTAHEIAALCELPRPVTYRILATLKAHKMIRVDSNGQYRLGYALVTLSRKVDTSFRREAQALLAQFAVALGATVYIGAEDQDELVCIVSAEPSKSGLRVRWREGLRRPMGVGASSVAILASRPPKDQESETVTRARARGYATSTSEVEEGVRATAVPIFASDGTCTLSLAVLQPEGAKPLGGAEIQVLKGFASQVADLLRYTTPSDFDEPHPIRS